MSNLEKLSADGRVTIRKAGTRDSSGACVVYWMQRAQRAVDNPALDCAVNVANEMAKPVVVFFAPVPFYPHANLRHFSFLRQGIADIAEALAHRRIGFVLRAYPEHHLLKFCEEVKACMVIGDENPLREAEDWRVRVARQVKVPFWTVDADVIVPSKLLHREHYAARTIRPRIRELIPEYLVKQKNPEARVRWKAPPGIQTLQIDSDFTRDWKIDRSVQAVGGRRGGHKEASETLAHFVRERLAGYPEQRNHPEAAGTSELSAYLHFGHIGPHTVALAVRKSGAPAAAKEAFLEQLIVRRELAVNFVHFNPTYDSVESAETWAERSLTDHARDRREFLYSEMQLEQAETHDPLWNAAQKQMVLSGWMHNYLRMYWAKKILEWSPTIAVALQRAIRLNDRYELDGRDPNGYAGIAWAIVGKHDRAWFERPIFGKIRYMSLASTSKKFDSEKYIAQIAELERGRTHPHTAAPQAQGVRSPEYSQGRRRMR